MKILILFLFFISSNSFSDSKEDHLVLQTNSGVIVIELDSEGTPEHFNQLTKLVELGIYNGTSFSYALENFYVQLGSESERKHVFYPTQRNAIKEMRNEITTFKHYRRSVTMPSSPDDTLKGGQFVFTIALDRLEELDEKQTIIGFVVKGMDVVDNISLGEKKNDKLNKPIIINYANIVTKDAALSIYDNYHNNFFFSDIALFNSIVFFFIIFIQISQFYLKNKIDKGLANAINLTVFLFSVFSFLVYLYPFAQKSVFLSLIFILLLLQSFKMLSTIEQSRGITKKLNH